MKTGILLSSILFVFVQLGFGQIINVPGDYSSIQDGIDAASDGDTVLVSDGTYYENISFEGKAIILSSHFLMNGDTNHINSTIIDGSQPANPNLASVVSFYSGEDTSSVLCGFTITGGTGNPFWGTYRVGGGIFCNGSSATIIHNKIIGNAASSDDMALGGGVFCSNNEIILRNNMIQNNSLDGINGSYGGGVYAFQTTYIHISENTIAQNIDITGGAGVFCQHPLGPIIVAENVFSNNEGLQTSIGYGGGLNIDDAYDHLVEIDRNRFIQNSSNNGGGFYEKNCFNLKLNNNVFIGNNGYYSGGAICIYHEEGNTRPEIINNTFFDNASGYGGGAISYFSDFTGSSPVLINSIFWENSASIGKEIRNYSSDTLFIYYSNIESGLISGPWIGGFNMIADPLFCDESCHLDYWTPSPCYNEGTGEIEIDGMIYYAPETDIDGEARPKNTYIDIGADEAPFFVDVADANEFSGTNLVISPNPARDYFKLISKPAIDVLSTEIIDIHGKTVLLQKAGNNELSFDISDLPKGLYFVRLITNKGIEVKKLVVQ